MQDVAAAVAALSRWPDATALAALTGMALYNAISSRLRDRGELGDHAVLHLEDAVAPSIGQAEFQYEYGRVKRTTESGVGLKALLSLADDCFIRIQQLLVGSEATWSQGWWTPSRSGQDSFWPMPAGASDMEFWTRQPERELCHWPFIR